MSRKPRRKKIGKNKEFSVDIIPDWTLFEDGKEYYGIVFSYNYMYSCGLSKGNLPLQEAKNLFKWLSEAISYIIKQTDSILFNPYQRLDERKIESQIFGVIKFEFRDNEIYYKLANNRFIVKEPWSDHQNGHEVITLGTAIEMKNWLDAAIFLINKENYYKKRKK